MMKLNLNAILKWTATAFTIGGAVAISLALDPLNIILLNIGSLFWVWWSLRIREYSILTVNIAMMLVYLYGAAIRL